MHVTCVSMTQCLCLTSTLKLRASEAVDVFIDVIETRLSAYERAGCRTGHITLPRHSLVVVDSRLRVDIGG